ncbi:MAG: CvpA family protein [Ferruginibacter sp.]|nr:CvpA family protein [Ferruginibacter sp.]
MIDIIFAIFIVLAIVKGYRKGLIIALFSIIALVVGLAAALKLSAAVAVHLQQNVTLSLKWLPVISFVLVFLLVVFLVHMGGKLIEKTFEMALLGWANRLGGVLLYIALYTIIFSVFLFYADKIKVFEKAAIEASQSYPVVQPLGPKVINGLGALIPLFKDMFSQLEDFFAGVSNKIQQ